MRRYRTKLRAQGLRPVQIWVPDTRAPGFAEEAKRQSELLSHSPAEEEVLEWMQAAIADWNDEWK